ncbi:MAG: dTDP-4-dehydrorhamnose 3,5-epimerase [Paludibacteraceae bacterium]|jgi:dTDP-4-dehydrorhamnose 3,5-epimerase|nr:dTDP-4-dehydrorhamnose 3,5-epimerase [Paludibacteraceae bacterium]MBQ2051278.1 dTDP-4-dehydrorhamnose 3,5-epimerase [Paludibacteraceae bacterium]MBQ3680233.1 dTDP-4-dehydrorhamnose 3,5-epimerase [Paludibacteraceae bacterium]MBQ3896681.1 dTDP-4-dehydrorhamnose 3,5-epimerase [Paludibacteraceae bacterium]MBQ6963263.1 dTDP-4-dehydrorhamnose 3,5-epimerase [Paludibacteraceae bacterium]
MELIETPIPDLYVIKNRLFADDRGYFTEAYNRQTFEKAGLKFDFCQDNRSKSSYGVVRGLHFQLNPKSQTKLVSCIQGKVYDVAVDIRQGSPTFGQWYGVELSEENNLQFLIPQGFAHGFSVLSETAVFTYKCDNFYAPELEGGISYDDPSLGIDWHLPADAIIKSEKDSKHPLLKDLKTNFIYNK